jgi:hypothetical protein
MRPAEAGRTEAGHVLVVIGAGGGEKEGGGFEGAVGGVRELTGRPLRQMRGEEV